MRNNSVSKKRWGTTPYEKIEVYSERDPIEAEAEGTLLI